MDAKDRAAARRREMVETQLRRRGVTDPRVLSAMERVPRERFVAPDQISRAFDDNALPLACGQTISQPYMVGLMTQELHVEPESTVLEIGTGSGYQCAVLAELAREVFTIERVAPLLERARALLDELGYTNIRYHAGDGTLGWPEPRRFDRILVTAGAPHRPDRLLAQLAPGGIMAAPVGDAFGQDLIVYRRDAEGKVSERSVCKCAFVPLVGEDAWPP